MEEKKFPTYKDHLNKSFLEELSYKLWVTKGARFYANKRLLSRDEWSTRANGFLSAYLIIFGLLSVYQVSTDNVVNEKFVAFGATAVSILLLAFSQMEAAQDYKMRAHFYLECSLKISSLYNELRIFKTLKNSTEEDKITFCEKLSSSYQKILEHYQNHDNIDYKIFKAEQWKYYEMTRLETVFINLNYYWKTTFFYHMLILIPPIVTTAVLL